MSEDEKPKKTAKKKAAAKKASPKKSPGKGAKPEFGAKSDFIRSLGNDTPAADIVAAAAKKGLTITAGLVYAVRAAAKKGGTAPKAGGAKRGPKPKGAAAPSSQEAQLRAAIADLGLVRARAVFAEVEAAFGGR